MNRLSKLIVRLLGGSDRAPTGELGSVPSVESNTAPGALELAEYRRSALLTAIAKMKIDGDDEAKKERVWKIPTPPPGVIPEGQKMAMDGAIEGYGAWAIQNSLFAEGQMFLGYPYLAELSQRPEYRVISKTWSQEMTRKWIRLVSTGDTDIGDKTEKLKELEAELKRLEVQDCFRQAIELDGFFGRAHIFLDLGVDITNRDELKATIGDGKALTEAKVTKGSLKSLRVIEPVWTYPNSYNADNPLRFDFFKPTTWFVMGMEIHDTRLLTFIGRPMPDLLKPAYSFGGLSLSQMAKPYVDNWLRTRQSVSDAISNFSVMMLLTDMAQLLNAGSAIDLAQRADFFNVARNNRGLMIADKNTEDLKNVSMPLGTLDHLQAQSQEHMSSVSEIPLVMLTGITPSGLNASSEEDVEVFHDKVTARQAAECDANLSKLLNIVQLSLWGEIDPDIGYLWEPLHTLDAGEEATRRKTRDDSACNLIDHGVIAPDEYRKVLASDENSPYASLDLDREIELPGAEAGGEPDDADNPDPGSENLEDNEELEEGTGASAQVGKPQGKTAQDSAASSKNAGVILLDTAGRGLFLKRGTSGDHPGEWCFPGGHFEKGETAAQTAARECKEETGFAPPAAQLKLVHDGATYATFVLPKVKQFKPIDDNAEHSAFVWRELLSPPEPLHPGCREAIRLLTQGALDAEFEESKHPRAPDGKFGTGGNGGESDESDEEVKKDRQRFSEAIKKAAGNKGLEISHETPYENLSAILRRGGLMDDTNFAAVQAPSNYVTGTAKARLWITVPKDKLSSIEPDWQYGGADGNPYKELLSDHSGGVKGSWVAISEKIPLSWISRIEVVSKTGAVVSTMNQSEISKEADKRRKTHAALIAMGAKK